MIRAANTTEITGSTGSLGSELGKLAEIAALRCVGVGTRSLRARGSTGSRPDLTTIDASVLCKSRELPVRAAA
jgi:hypothetical protein